MYNSAMSKKETLATEEGKRKSNAAPKPKTMLIIAVIVFAAAILAAVYFLMLPGKSPVETFARLRNSGNQDKPNVLLITLDTTRADRLGCYGYEKAETPHMDKLASEGVLFQQCVTTNALTLPAHSSIMTGLYPTYHGVRVNGNTALSETHQTLAEIYGDQGYQCGAFIAAFVLDGRWGLKQGFHHYDDSFELSKYKQLDLGKVQRPGSEVVDSALAWLEQQKEKPFFSWVHLYDPHTPYEPPEPYRSRHFDGGISGLYDGEMAYTDEQVGRLLSWLEKNNLDKDTFVVIIGDHGEGLGDHGEITHGYYIYDYGIHVPFLVRTPFEQIKGVRVPAQVSVVDLYPTLLEMTGIQPPPENQGVSLLPLITGDGSGGNGEEERYAYSESMAPNIQYGWSPLHSLRTVKYKYIDTPRAELYNLEEDPQEKRNIIYRYPKVVRRFKKELTRLMEETAKGAPEPEAANLDQETLQRLATLGYVGTRVKRKKGEQLSDPKDKFEVYKSIHMAGEMVTDEQYEEAARVLENALAKDPNIHQAMLLLSTCYAKLERPDDARVQLDRILKDDPNSIQALLSLATILMDEKKTGDVLTLCRKALSVDSRNTQAHILMGDVYMMDRDYQQALTHLEEAVKIQPKLTRNRLNLAICLVGLQRHGEAETIIKSILEKYPKFPMAHYHLGLLYEEQGRYNEAKDAYSHEVELSEISYQARFNLGKMLLRFGDRAGYIKQMEDVVRLAPKMAQGHLFLARGLLLESGDLDRILELVHKGLETAKDPRIKALGYFLLADVYNRKKQPSKVKEALEKANYYKSQTD